ncbi:MAG TPA: Tim44-like domain-containing protein [Casimicrobiaceae bacterium]|nr:Tim44-like domain-containing protein [Casimicrobiaceae bacterium]
MNRLAALAAIALALTAWTASDVADAKRLGGSRSFGSQRQITPAPSPAPSAPSASPSTPAPAQAAPRTAPAPAASGASRWLGPLAGLAAGLGLAALLSHFGLSESFASLLLLLLLAGGGIVLVRMLLARRSAPASPLAYAGGPAERVEPHLGSAGGPPEPVASAPPQGRSPPGFDPAPFVEQAKLSFRKMQAAYDAADRQTLAEMMTPEMLAEVSRDLAERGPHEPTEVMRLDATILDVATEGREHWMSVRFTGLLREDGTVLPKGFEEVWNLVKPVDDSSGWLLAGIQQAHEVA